MSLIDRIFYIPCSSVWLFCCIVWKIRIFGINNIPSKGVVIASNHQSFLDPILITAIFKKRIYYILRTTLQGFLFKLITLPWKLIYIRRGEADITAVKSAIEVLRNGESVLMFPEGTRSSDGHPGRIREGFILVSEKSGANIVPITIDGSYKCWGKKQKFPKFGSITITIHPPIVAKQDNKNECKKYLEQCWRDTIRQSD